MKVRLYVQILENMLGDGIVTPNPLCNVENYQTLIVGESGRKKWKWWCLFFYSLKVQLEIENIIWIFSCYLVFQELVSKIVFSKCNMIKWNESDVAGIAFGIDSAILHLFFVFWELINFSQLCNQNTNSNGAYIKL